jgi:DNA-binding GntR family transcriptional regulator
VRDSIAREYILNDSVPPGSLLPSEKDLSERYGVSRITVRAGLRSLQEAGLVSIRHGVGSRVLPRSHAMTHGLDRLSSLETFAVEAGQLVETTQLEWEEVQAREDLAQRFAVPVGHPLLAIRRVKVIGGSAVGWMLDYIPEGVLPFDVVRQQFEGSILDVLLSHPEAGIEYADAEIKPISLPADIARRLDVKRGSAALFVEAVASTADGHPVELAQAWLLPEHFRFSVRRRRPIGG